MARAIPRVLRAVAAVTAMMLLALPAVAQTLLHRAENQVPVAMVKVVRTTAHTEVHLQTLAALKDVCWYATGPNSPYLLAENRRYRYVSGDNIKACPAQQTYADREVMVLRFEPLAPQTRTFSLVEGEGGENQMVDPASTKSRFWNFLRVKLD